MHSYARFFPILSALLLTACPTEPEGRAKEPHPEEDEWSRLPPSKEWLFATSDFNGPHKAECEFVLTTLKNEASCKASLCEYAKNLASEWMTRCKPFVSGSVIDEGRAMRSDFDNRSNDKATDCGKSFTAIQRDGCGDSTACAATGQRWATRCAKSEGTPLTLKILTRTIQRRQEGNSEPFDLDPRTCAELRGELLEGAKCKDRFACDAQMKSVSNYRDRCQSESERPSIVAAVAQETILAGAGKPPEVIVVQPDPQIQADELPVVLDDHLGAILSVCDDRASDLARYLNARKSCQDGRLVVARTFPTPRGPEVRVGSLDFPDDTTFSARYPTIVAAREHELRDTDGTNALEAALKEAAHTASANPAQAMRLLVKAVNQHALVLRRSAGAKAVLEKFDGDLAPALREIAKLKIAATKGRVPPADLAAMVGRGRTRAFADVTMEGTVQFGALTKAATLDTTHLLPKAMGAYLDVLKAQRPRKPDARLQQAEKAKGLSAASACGAAMKKLKEAKNALLQCNFGMDVCDEAKQTELAKSVDAARVTVETAYRDLDGARLGAAAAEATSLTEASDAAGCREPWW